MANRKIDDYARIQRKKAEIRKRRKRKRRQRITTLAVAFVVLIASISYITLKVVQGDVFIKNTEEASTEEVAETTPTPTPTPVATATPVPESSEESVEESSADTSTVSPSTGYSVADWTYTTTESAPDGDIVDADSDYTYERMERDIYFLKQRYGQYMSVNVIGYSCDGRELLDCVVGDASATKDIIVQYSMHAREYITTSVAMLQLEEILENYDTGTWNGRSYSELLSKVRLHIIPMINPDGVTLSQTCSLDSIQSEELREVIQTAYSNDNEVGKGSSNMADYLRTWKANGRAVDLNRNFASSGWTADMAMPRPSTNQFPGTEPNSEPEVQAILNLEQHINCVAQIAYHAHGNLMYYDYGMDSIDPELYETDYQLAETLAATTALDDGTTYKVLSTVEDDQNPGGCSDYFMQILHIPSVTIEVGDNYTADGSYNDPPLSADQASSIYERNKHILAALADAFAD